MNKETRFDVFPISVTEMKRMRARISQVALPLLLAPWLSACVAQYWHAPAKDAKPTTPAAHAPNTSSASFHDALRNRSDAFLYMASRAAIGDGNGFLALRFLEALRQRGDMPLLPGIDLARLYLLQHRASEAAALLREMGARFPVEKQAEDMADRLLLRSLYASALEQQGKPQEAIETLRALLEQHPSIVSLRVQLARMLSDQGRTGEARRWVEQGLRKQESAPLLNAIIDIELREKRWSQALYYAHRLTALRPDDGQAVILLSSILAQQGKISEAKKTLRAFLARYPAAIGVANQLGKLLIRERRIEEATKLYQELLRYGEAMDRIYSTLGMLYYEQKQYEAAADAFREALRLDPKNDEFHFYLAVNLDVLNRLEEAQRHYRLVSEKSKRYPISRVRMAAIVNERGDAEQAKAILHALLRKHADFPDAWSMLSVIYIEQKAYQKLLEETEPALRLPKVPRELLINRAIAYDHFHRYEEMEQTIGRLLRQNPKDPDALNFIGYSLAERGIRLEEAERYVKKALAQRPDNGFYLDSLAWIYYQRGQYRQAESTQRNALQQLRGAPIDPIMYEHLGDILWQRKLQEEAREAWQKALDAMPPNAERRKAVEQRLRHGLPQQ